MTEITVTADKSIHIICNEKNYCGESKPDIFRILVPLKFNGISLEDARITFNYKTPSGKIGMVSLNEIDGIRSRLGSYYIFELRMNEPFYESDGNVRCWVEFQSTKDNILIKSECGLVYVEKHCV